MCAKRVVEHSWLLVCTLGAGCGNQVQRTKSNFRQRASERAQAASAKATQTNTSTEACKLWHQHLRSSHMYILRCLVASPVMCVCLRTIAPRSCIRCVLSPSSAPSCSSKPRQRQQQLNFSIPGGVRTCQHVMFPLATPNVESQSTVAAVRSIGHAAAFRRSNMDKCSGAHCRRKLATAKLCM
jgi:hypothetical protein